MNNIPKDFCVFVDADSCPVAVRENVFLKASEFNFSVVFAANRALPCPSEPDFNFLMKVCEKGKDKADDFIFQNIKEHDIAITRDLLLAQRLLQKNITVINDRGTVFTKDNITHFLEERELSLQMENLGLKKGKNWKTYGKNEIQEFKKCFCREIEKRL